jgi:3-hydroxybutyrate dehydrogenase
MTQHGRGGGTCSLALITGSLGGIGFAIAKALAAQGCYVMLNGFADAATIDARQSELRELGVSVAYHAADLRDPTQIADLIHGRAWLA